MEAIILAGGEGKRLRKLVPNVPKPMAPINGRPFLEILLYSLSQKGINRVILSVGFMADKIISYFGKKIFGIEIIYEIEKFSLGTGGAVSQAIRHCLSDHVFVFNGDTYLDLELSEIEAQWQINHNPIIIGRHISDTFRYGRIIENKGQIIEFKEKGTSGPGLINAGCYVFPIKIFDEFIMGESFSLESDFLVNVIKTKRFDVFVTQGYLIDIGVPEDYIRAQYEMKLWKLS